MHRIQRQETLGELSDRFKAGNKNVPGSKILLKHMESQKITAKKREDIKYAKWKHQKLKMQQVKQKKHYTDLKKAERKSVDLKTRAIETTQSEEQKNMGEISLVSQKL